MDARARDKFWSLTEKEKQALRLIVRGHDAKSTARSLGLSVHTVNERLRGARRKMAVSSSREAARLLFEAERGPLAAPDFVGPKEMRDAGRGPVEDGGCAPVGGAGRAWGLPLLNIGVLAMTLALALAALLGLPQAAPPASRTEAVAETEVVGTARRWLALLDEGRWNDSYRETGSAFRRLNTPAVWARASERVRAPLGAMRSRVLIGQENLPAPPDGYEVVKFRTGFAARAEAVETVTLEQEGGHWRVVGITVG
jgi:DNA-binding CsgD family transcriptional regulator